MSIKVGIAPDSWGVWFPASNPNNEKQPPWWRCLDENAMQQMLADINEIAKR